MSGTFIGDQTAVIDTSTSSGLPPDTKEKAAPVSRAKTRALCCLLDLGGCGTRSVRAASASDWAQTVLADFPEVKRAARRDTGAPTAQCRRCA